MHDLLFKLPVCRDHAELAIESPRTEWGAPLQVQGRYWRRVLVEPNGTLRAWCPIARHYSRHHDLSELEQANALRIACLVRVGRLRIYDGWVTREEEQAHA